MTLVKEGAAMIPLDVMFVFIGVAAALAAVPGPDEYLRSHAICTAWATCWIDCHAWTGIGSNISHNCGGVWGRCPISNVAVRLRGFEIRGRGLSSLPCMEGFHCNNE